jgi:hypothetical protein
LQFHEHVTKIWIGVELALFTNFNLTRFFLFIYIYSCKVWDHNILYFGQPHLAKCHMIFALYFLHDQCSLEKSIITWIVLTNKSFLTVLSHDPKSINDLFRKHACGEHFYAYKEHTEK